MPDPFDRIDFKLNEETVIGRAKFQPPFKADDEMVNEARFVYMVKGNSKLNVPKSSAGLTSGDAFLMKSESFINQHFINDDGSKTEMIVFRLIPGVLKQLYGADLPEVFRVHNTEVDPLVVIKKNDMMDHFIQGIRQYFQQPSLASEEVLKIKLRELIQLLVNLDSDGKIRSILGSLFVQNQYQLSDVVEANLYEDLQLKDLAHLSGLSLSSFKRQFNKIYGSSPTKYIIGRRMDRAQFLLESSVFNVSEIAYDIGFNDLGHFSKTFHQHVGMSPSEYRAQFN